MGMLGKILFFISIVMFSPMTQAHMRLEPAYRSQIAGPARAQGAVVWSHGHGLGSEESSAAPTPPYLLTLQQHGWDVLRFNRGNSDDAFTDSSEQLAVYARQLKRRGYRKVVLAGHSFGGWLSLMVGSTSDFIDTVIAVAPAAYGCWSELDAHSWLRNTTELYPLLSGIHVPVMLFFFAADTCDPGGRGAVSEQLLTQSHVRHLVVDRPPGLSSHWAESTQQFKNSFAKKILRFISQ
jgi:pimeloyl-ACP methyl ester carboxylesterase